MVIDTLMGLPARARPTHRAFSPEALVRLTERCLVEVRAHTVTEGF